MCVVPNFEKKNLLQDLKTKISINPLLVGDFNIMFSNLQVILTKKISKVKSELIDIDVIHQMDLIDIYRTK